MFKRMDPSIAGGRQYNHICQRRNTKQDVDKTHLSTLANIEANIYRIKLQKKQMTIRRNVFPPDQYFFNILDKALDVYTLITNMFY